MALSLGLPPGTNTKNQLKMGNTDLKQTGVQLDVFEYQDERSHHSNSCQDGDKPSTAAEKDDPTPG